MTKHNTRILVVSPFFLRATKQRQNNITTKPLNLEQVRNLHVISISSFNCWVSIILKLKKERKKERKRFTPKIRMLCSS